MTLKLTDFAGFWRLQRQIIDRVQGDARFDGRAEFTSVDQGLAYRERGDLILSSGQRLHAQRDYHWRMQAGRIYVEYADGRSFHDFAPGDAQAQHWCAPDSYHVRYDFADWPNWSSHWSVQGPRKSYEMTSHYQKMT
ncbi:hypothetical protein BFP70_02890 [Thioclava sp. SK-1]|uniref:DUF6314 family protein n=1 Tax=Thioclava sp. SK-1 TaxID=1889770 RepID=UPI0008243E28|nr:DUF6314 family protein [Thioclava sp. SK-1]OCX67124.1 hypothetical protein BFP70_02890 [Thioclava sp. SK-1]